MMKIIFMGSPAFAVPSLQALLKANHKIDLVLCQPDKPAGRGLHLHSCPVATFAKENNLDLFQPKSLKNKSVQQKLASLNPDIIVVVAYGKFLPKPVLDLPKHGCINVHASLLPKYRGAAPINWAIVNGEIKTGVTTMLLNEEMDAGDILLKKETEISPEDTTSMLHDRLAEMGADLLLETIDQIAKGTISPQAQNHQEASYAPLLTKEDGLINWQKSAQEIHNLIRGMQPWPMAYTYHQGKFLRIFRTTTKNENPQKEPGTVISAENELGIATGDGILYLQEVQLEGKKCMPIADFLRGHKIDLGEKLS